MFFKEFVALFFAFLISGSLSLPIESIESPYDKWERQLSTEDILKLNNLSPGDLAEMYSGQIEGDMIMDENGPTSFNGRLDVRMRWRNNLVPYWINNTFFNQEQIDYIHLAAHYIHDRTCLRFVNRTTQTDFIFITGDSAGCAAVVGRRGGPQRIRLRPSALEQGCFRFFTIVHEFMHALGFHHMQNSFDRDRFLQINWENVRTGSESSFHLRPRTQITHFAVPYDVGSVMHYGANAFSGNGRDTMTALVNPFNRTMGQRHEMTHEDILRINRMYNCLPTPRA